MKFSELTGRARDKALAKLSEWNTYHDWWEFTYAHAKETAKERGMEIEDIEFQGFYCQSSYAVWRGSISLLQWIDWRAKHRPDPSLLPTLTVLGELIGNYVDNRVSVYINRHSMRTEGIDVGNYDDEESVPSGFYLGANVSQLVYALDWDGVEKLVLSDCEDMAQEIYENLRDEYEYLTSEEAAAEMAEANDYQFDEEGELQ
jgi:hypothetical protein